MSFLDPIFNPILNLGPVYAVVIFSFLIALIMSLVYKFMTDQNLMKRLKAEMKELQKEMKELRDHPEKLMQVQKKSMETNMKYMTQSFKPTLITFIPIIIIFGWMSAHLGYYPLMEESMIKTSVELEDMIGYNATLVVPEGIELVSDSTQKINSDIVEWNFKGKEGEYSLGYDINGNMYEKELIISSNYGDYSDVVQEFDDGVVKSIKLNNKRVQPIKEIGLGWIPWFGNFGWLGSYILCSIIFSIVIRKFLKIA